MSGRVVWAITSGEYSDWRVAALFTTEAVAQNALKQAKADRRGSNHFNDHLTEFMLFDHIPAKVVVWRRSAVLFMDGRIEQDVIEKHEGPPWSMPWWVSAIPERGRPVFEFVPTYYYRPGLQDGRLFVIARTKRECNHAFGEKLAVFKAWQAGLSRRPRWYRQRGDTWKEQ